MHVSVLKLIVGAGGRGDHVFLHAFVCMYLLLLS
jgi:hypothetical protein